MTISESDYKLLWGRAAGICSNPDCRADLTILLEESTAYHIGEMAHVIARSADGPRGEPGGGPDKYGNLILLCPSCHRKIDKAPAGTFTTDTLHAWKAQHETEIRKKGSNHKFETVSALKTFVSRILIENKESWKQLGPNSMPALSDPGSNMHVVWQLRKLDTIVPNNRKIINTIEANIDLLNPPKHRAFVAFKLHAEAFETHQYRRLDSYPLFPEEFEKEFAE